MFEYKFIPYEENGEIKYKKIKIEKFKSPKEYDRHIKSNQKNTKRLNFHKKRLSILKEKVQSRLYPTDNLWDEFIRLVSETYYEGFWTEFKSDFILIVKTLSLYRR